MLGEARERWWGISVSVKISRQDDRLVLVLPEEFDAAAAEHADAVIDEALDDSIAHLYLDMSQTSFIDSTGIGLVVYASRRAQTSGTKVSVCAAHNQPLALMKTLRLDRVFKFIDELPQIDA